MKKLDLIIIGTGPAGLTASIYAARYKLEFLTIGRAHGGVATEAFKIQNYPGTPEITGTELGRTMEKQAKDLGADIVADEVKAIKKDKDGFLVVTNKKKYKTNYIILALGTERRKLSVPGEEEFHGRGVAYCATCDGFFFKKKVVSVIGGGDSAITAAIFLADLAKKVYIINRSKDFKANPSWMDKAKKNKKIEILTERSIKEIMGANKVEKISFNETDEELELDGIFIEIGATPAVAILKDLKIKTDETKHIIINKEGETNIENVFAAGDLTTGSNKLKQVVTAAAEGAITTAAIYKKIKKSK